MPTQGLENDLEKVLGALTNVFASEGDTRAVAILAMSTASIVHTDHDNWNGGIDGYMIYLEIPQTLYYQLGTEVEAIEQLFKAKSEPIVRLYDREWIAGFVVSTELVDDPNWREKAKAWVSGQGISNQGRVRSDNLAPRVCDGLLFRSQAEINLYRAFRGLGISVAPLPVFVRGGQTYRRIEVDFLIIRDGITLVVEVDGDTVHRESPQEAHDRLTMLAHEGVKIERVNANECSSADKAMACAKRLIEVIEKLRTNR